jgi:hypothetical protein
MSGPNPEKGVGVTTLAKLFDLTPMRVQQLASAGVVVKVAHGTYALGESVKNYIKFLRERADRTGGSRELTEVKRLIAEEDLKMKKRENSVRDKDVVAADEIRNTIILATAKWGSILATKLETEAPARLVGKDGAEMREEMRAVVEELSELSRGIFYGEIAPEIMGGTAEGAADEATMAAELGGEETDDAEDPAINR